MGTLLNSFDSILSQNSAQGPLPRQIALPMTAASPAANTTSGYVNVARCARTFTVPTLGGSVTAAFMTSFRAAYCQNSSLIVAAIETDLGNINMSTGTWTTGSSMPTKTVEGSSITTASMLTVAVVTSAVTATTPAMTFTYTNQAGTGSKTCSMTLPTNPTLNTGYLMTPHLANGDTGIRSVSAATKSAGSAGVINVKGLLPIGFAQSNQTGTCHSLDPLALPWPMIPLAASDVIAFYVFGSTAAGDLHVQFTLEGDN